MEHRFRHSIGRGCMAAALIGLAGAAIASSGSGYAGFRIGDAEANRYLSRAWQACIDRAVSTADMRDCSSQEYGRLDRRLNQVYRNRMTRLAPPARIRLRDAQRAWLGVRFDHCTPGGTGGTADLLNADGCVQREVIRRIAWLERYRP